MIDYLNYPDGYPLLNRKDNKKLAGIFIKNYCPELSLLFAIKERAIIDDYHWNKQNKYKKYKRPIIAYKESMANYLLNEIKKVYNTTGEKNYYLSGYDKKETEFIEEKMYWSAIKRLRGIKFGSLSFQ